MAAIDYITVQENQTAAVQSGDLKQVIRSLRFAFEGLQRHQAIMRHNFNDGVNPIDWTGVEARYGLAPGQGVRLFTFVDGSVLAMTGGQQNTACKDLTETVG